MKVTVDLPTNVVRAINRAARKRGISANSIAQGFLDLALDSESLRNIVVMRCRHCGAKMPECWNDETPPKGASPGDVESFWAGSFRNRWHKPGCPWIVNRMEGSPCDYLKERTVDLLATA